MSCPPVAESLLGQGEGGLNKHCRGPLDNVYAKYQSFTSYGFY